ncbi:uncharacterized protein [Henckelia pumila]|uniref:uncharacterized protein n=1 Tax=Henckelia pumila TaxID=405737 RepID=UPI003C6E155A
MSFGMGNVLLPLSWTKPPKNMLKCNVDATILPNPPHAEYGCIIRDHHGVVLAAFQGRINGNQDPTIAEVLAIREALSWLKNFHFSSIIVKFDSLVTIEAHNNAAIDRSSFGFLVEDCKLLVQGVSSCSFVFIRRSAY